MRDVADGGSSHDLTNGKGGLPDVPGLDGAAAREFAAWTDFLDGLRQAQSEPPLPSISSALGPADLEPIARWYVVLRGVRRLTEVAGLREHLEGLPPCLSSARGRSLLTGGAHHGRSDPADREGGA